MKKIITPPKYCSN